jgi:hypothetical protein
MTEENVKIEKKKKYVYDKRKFAIKVFFGLIVSLLAYVFLENFLVISGFYSLFDERLFLKNLVFIVVMLLGYYIFKIILIRILLTENNNFMIRYPESTEIEAERYFKNCMLIKYWYVILLFSMFYVNGKLGNILFI